LLSKYKEFKDIDDAEEKFPDFLYDIVDGVRSGMPLTQAIKISRNNDYGALSSFVRKLAAKIDWGMNFDKALTYFADSIGSKDIKRSTRTIVQSYYSGGEIADVLEAVAQNMREIRKLKKERQLELYGELITAYVVFFVFLASIIMFSKFILPLLFVSANIQPITGGEESLRFILLSFDRIFTYIIIIQAIFFGLIIGKLIYGSYKAGVKHSIFMTAVGYLAASIFL
jgi:flagellar protein FlaJ